MRRIAIAAVAVTATGAGALALPTALASAAAGPHAAAPARPAVTILKKCSDTADHENAAHSGFSCAKLKAAAKQVWTATLNGAVSYPVADARRVFVSTSAGSLFALNGKSGKIVWGPVAIPGTGTAFPLAFGAKQVYANAGDGTVTAFNASTGAQVWSTATSASGGEPIDFKGDVWVEGTGLVYGLNQATGAIAVTSAAVDGNGASPAGAGSQVFVSTGCQSQIGLSLTGTITWADNATCSGSSAGGGPAAVFKGSVYGSDGGTVVAAATGASQGTFTGAPAFSGSDGFFASGAAVTALNVTSANAPVWSATLPANVVAGPVATAAAVWVGLANSTVVALNPATGAVLNTLTVSAAPGGANDSNIAVGDDHLLVPAGSTLTAFK